MVTSLQRGGLRRWIPYVLATVALLYTHHWGWLIAIGQQVAIVCLVFGTLRPRWRSTVKSWLYAWIVIVAAYLPWMSALLFQARHAGHAPVVIDGIGRALAFAVVSGIQIVQTLFVGSSAGMPAVVTGCIACLAALIAWRGERHLDAPQEKSDAHQPIGEIAVRSFLIVIVSSLVTGFLLSARSNMLLPRCIAMLAPLALLLLAQWCVTRRENRLERTLSAGLLALVATSSAFAIPKLIATPRSNARALAASVEARAKPTDMLILLPEWYAPSFNHYFNSALEQVDYPHDGRARLIDFSNVWERTMDVAPLAALEGRIAQARLEGRRIWLVSASQYLGPISERELAAAKAHHQPGPFSVLRVSQVRAMLGAEYGEPDSSLVTQGRKPRYDELRAYLYSPARAGVSATREQPAGSAFHTR
jgi:hypothetical protein